MRRLSLYLGGLSWGSRLQLLALLLILGFWVWIDVNHGIWPVTIVIVLFAITLGRLMLPVMLSHPTMTHRLWSSFGFLYLIVYLSCQRQWWWRTVAAHFGREILLWLEVSCGYWFISELRLRQQAMSDANRQDSDDPPVSDPSQTMDG